MKFPRTQIGLLWFSVLFIAGCAQVQESNVPSDSITQSGHHHQAFEKTITKQIHCNYLLFLPEDYELKKSQWPLILFLHGMGQWGNDLDKVKELGIPKIVEDRPDFPFIVLSPQCPEAEVWSNDVLIHLLDDVISRYPVDKDRIYCTGLSLGGGGTWRLACEYPDRFAAIAPVCGWGDPEKACQLKKVPVWTFHGAKDKIAPVKLSEEMVRALKDCGGDAQLTIYPEAGHDSWTQTYDNQELYNWFLTHRRTGEAFNK